MNGRLWRWMGLGVYFTVAAVLANFAVEDAWSAPQKKLDAPRSVRVRLMESKVRFDVGGMDLRWGSLGKNFNTIQSAAAPDNSEWRVDCEKLGPLKPRAVKARKGARSSRMLANIFSETGLMISSPAGFIRVNGHRLRGSLHIIKTSRGCDLVNQLDIEKYLEGLVNAEFSSKWNPEAVKAQIIAARSYALNQVLHRRSQGGEVAFDLEADIRDQVYRGTKDEDYRSARLVRESKGLVLAPQKGAGVPLKAYYHSTCGGKTELPQEVWGDENPNYRQRVNCPYCQESPSFSWSNDFKSAELALNLRKNMLSSNESQFEALTKNWPINWRPVIARGDLMRIKTQSNKHSGRIDSLETIWKLTSSKGRDIRILKLDLPATTFRNWMGTKNIKSTDFKVTRKRRTFHFTGNGFGHGVGLCQWGAKKMGEEGKTHQEILQFYYPTTRLTRLWK